MLYLLLPRLVSSGSVFRAGLFVVLSMTMGQACAATLKVGPERKLTLPSQAAKLARKGDIIEIDAGIYRQDAAVWRANGLTIRGVGGMAQLISDGVTAKGKGIWVIVGHDTTVENIEFQGARVPSHNGAGIRQEGRNLTLRHCTFKNNENGILAGANPDSSILIEDSEFEGNGYGDGRTHNIYIGAIRNFTLRDSYSHDAKVGHLVKSRAQTTRILNNRLMDGETGNSSYLLDLPNGGQVEIRGNTLQQGPKAENGTLVSFGAEHKLLGLNSLVVEDNTFINDRRHGCRLLYVTPRISMPARVANNHFRGCSRMDGPVEAINNEIIDADQGPPIEKELLDRPGN